MKRKNTFLSQSRLLLLVLAFTFYTISGIGCKLVSMHDFMSLCYIVLMLFVVLILGIYAILWQKVLSFMPLNKAFLCKSVTILMILAISALVFNETVTTNNIIGAGFIMSGLGVLAWKE